MNEYLIVSNGLDILNSKPYCIYVLDNILHSLKIKAKCKSIKEHRHYRLYDIELSPGQSIKKIEANVREIGLGLRSLTVPFVTTIPESGIVRLQVAMSEAETIPFNELYDRSIAVKPEGLLPFLLGEQANGEPVWLDMATNPHMLVAGSTGSGKSVLLHTLIANVKKRSDVSLYLVDPKHGVEFHQYNDNCNSLVFDYSGTVKMLQLLADEVEIRYNYFRKLGIKNINESQFVVPKVLVIIDEVADLMMQDEDGILETLLVKISQKSRAVGIHMVLATQRPSVDVLTGLIKANFPARVACRVSSAVDSKVIIDQSGAEHLLNKGDAILNCNMFNNVRFQIAYSS